MAITNVEELTSNKEKKWWREQEGRRKGRSDKWKGRGRKKERKKEQ